MIPRIGLKVKYVITFSKKIKKSFFFQKRQILSQFRIILNKHFKTCNNCNINIYTQFHMICKNTFFDINETMQFLTNIKLIQETTTAILHELTYRLNLNF
jgi:hypothetical protein